VSGCGAFTIIVILEYLCELIKCIKCITGLADRRARAFSVVRVFGQ